MKMKILPLVIIGLKKKFNLIQFVLKKQQSGILLLFIIAYFSGKKFVKLIIFSKKKKELLKQNITWSTLIG